MDQSLDIEHHISIYCSHLRLYCGGPDDFVGVLLTGLVGSGEAGGPGATPPLDPAPLLEPLFLADLLSSLWELRCLRLRSSGCADWTLQPTKLIL